MSKENGKFTMKPRAVAIMLPMLSPSAKDVMELFCHKRDYGNDEVSLGLRYICDETGISDLRTASKAVEQLVEVGLLRVIQQGRPGRGNRGIWQIIFEVDSPPYRLALAAQEERRIARLGERAKGGTIPLFRDDLKGGMSARKKVEPFQHGSDSLPDSSSDSLQMAAPATASPPPARPQVKKSSKMQQHADPDTAPVLLTFPCAPGKRNDSTTWELRQSLVDDWSTTYPAIDVLQLCRHVLEWLRSHPRQLKTADRMRAWISGVWLQKEQDKAHSAPANGPGRSRRRNPAEDEYPQAGDGDIPILDLTKLGEPS